MDCANNHNPARDRSFSKPKYELAQVFSKFGHDFKTRTPLLPDQHKVMHHIEVCRTTQLGGHIEKCDHCAFEKISYNSCRNRHCPKCQYLTKEQWLEDRKSELLPVGYFHNVFTLPHELNPIVLYNKKACFDILFKSVNETLQGFAENPKWKLKGKLGWIGILHSWDQKLLDHYHIHCLIPACALSFDKSKWAHAKKEFLFPVKALSKIFRAKFLGHLKELYKKQTLKFSGPCAQYKSRKDFKNLIDALFQKNWIVYSKRPFAGPEQVLAYLGRYTHRIAITNHRIKDISNKVSFTYKDRADDNKTKTMALNSDEFMRRFLLHVLPKGYTRIRHFGFLSNRNKSKNIAICRKLLGQSHIPKIKEQRSLEEKMLHLMDIDITECPKCKKGKLKFLKDIIRRKGKTKYFDSS
ncbi:MAG: IS91 family transposase [bacterium]|nr:IS91 family transposase [bacterium]MBU1918691.1 IS91 family transposase [bacterium]